MEDKKTSVQERKPLLALALSLFLAGLGQVYTGRPGKGLLFFLSSLVFPFLLIQFSVVGPEAMAIPFLLLALLSGLGIYVGAARDAWKQARRTGKNYELKFYNKLSLYIVLILFLNLLSLGRIVDLSRICFLALPFRNASLSMMPSLLPGDYILTDKRFSPSAEDRGLHRGELVVFKNPLNKNQYSLKRIVGLPGDKIEIKGTDLYINGKKRTGERMMVQEERWEEALSMGTIALSEMGDLGKYVVFYMEGAKRSDQVVLVPEGSCFVLGDNRDQSVDSRHWRMVPLSDVVARARKVYFSVSVQWGIRWHRIGKSL